MEHPIATASPKGLNSKIMTIKRKAGDFRNPSNFTTAIYFHCGGFDVYPRSSALETECRSRRTRVR
jgi:transposase